MEEEQDINLLKIEIQFLKEALNSSYKYPNNYKVRCPSCNSKPESEFEGSIRYWKCSNPSCGFHKIALNDSGWAELKSSLDKYQG